MFYIYSSNSNFRNYESEIFRFDNETNTIIGENDSGENQCSYCIENLIR
ncbi:recombinational DNA repair ATPase, RecF_1 [Staphylococcus aureus]|uniref:Recombinational DNA repair ATPase, RecF_1 n=1 Tax=Staphylococcus aureus TaxID=1280 RepID=A0A380EDN1_STAAU|nr:recombinational DNA repair ATPase, RecF_1 [Staphylococcus aureus]